MITAACIAIVCVTLLVALVLVLRHLAAMRATTGEMAELKLLYRTAAEVERQTFVAHGLRLDDLDKRLVHLNNRTQR